MRPRSLRLDYAQFLELEIFTRFGGMPDARVKAQLARGQRVRAVLAQDQHAPLRLVDEVALVLALQSGGLDDVAPEAIGPLRQALPAAVDAAGLDGADLRQAMSETLKTRLVEAAKALAASVAT